MRVFNNFIMKETNRTHKEDAYGWKPPEQNQYRGNGYKKQTYRPRGRNEEDEYFYQKKDDSALTDNQIKLENTDNIKKNNIRNNRKNNDDEFFWNQDFVNRGNDKFYERNDQSDFYKKDRKIKEGFKERRGDWSGKPQEYKGQKKTYNQV